MPLFPRYLFRSDPEDAEVLYTAVAQLHSLDTLELEHPSPSVLHPQICALRLRVLRVRTNDAKDLYDDPDAAHVLTECGRAFGAIEIAVRSFLLLCIAIDSSRRRTRSATQDRV